MTADELARLTLGKEMGFAEAERYFDGKVPVTRKEFLAIQEEYRTLAFKVAGYVKVQIIRRFQEVLSSAIADGKTLRDFKAEMDTFLRDHGYKGLTPYQADDIFRTNIQTAYNVGHYRQMTSTTVKTLRPYWQYVAVQDSHTRPAHRAMDGRVYPADSAVWDTWYPPNGYRCRCTVVTLSQREVERLGLTVEAEVPRRVQAADGTVITIQPDPLFQTNPAKRDWSPDLTGYPPALVKAYKAMHPDT